MKYHKFTFTYFSQGNGYQGSGSGPGRARRDSAARAMQGWHAQRLGAGEVGDPIIKVCLSDIVGSFSLICFGVWQQHGFG